MASLDMVGEAEGLMRFQADRISVSGTSRELYSGSKDSTGEPYVSNYSHIPRQDL